MDDQDQSQKFQQINTSNTSSDWRETSWRLRLKTDQPLLSEKFKCATGEISPQELNLKCQRKLPQLLNKKKKVIPFNNHGTLPKNLHANTPGSHYQFYPVHTQKCDLPTTDLLEDSVSGGFCFWRIATIALIHAYCVNHPFGFHLFLISTLQEGINP